MARTVPVILAKSASRWPAAAMTSRLPAVRGLMPLIVFLIAWQLLQRGQSPYFPRPSTWWTSIVLLTQEDRLLPAIGATLKSFAYGLTAAALFGGTVGVLIGMSRRASRILGPLLEFCRALPPPVVVPVAVLLLGYSENLKLLVVGWAAAWPILLNTASATRLIDPLLLDVARTFRLTRTKALAKIIIPAVIPAFLLGVRVAVPLAITITLLIEMITSMPGIGALIALAGREFRSSDVYGMLVLVGLLGFILNNAFVLFEGAVLSRWPPRVS